jgi:succinate dehydrogenase / fumarate reductase membrane anchor subunit
MMRDQKLWSWHVGAGIVILVFLCLHMTIMHLDSILRLPALNPAGGEPIDWQNVVARGKTLFFPVTYVVLLGAALFHGLYGLRNVLFELDPKPGLRGALSVLLIVVGLGLFVLGTWSALASHSLARTLSL